MSNRLNNTVIDYDKRERNTLIETDRITAITALTSLITGLVQIESDFSVNVLCSTNTNAKNLPTSSSLKRELVFLHSHTTHHMAIIRMIALLMQISVNDDFGKAASTQKFERNVQS